MKKIIFILDITILLIGCSVINKTICYNGCVYSSNSNVVKIGEKFTHYERNYKKLNKKYFLGYKLGKNNKITNGYVCVNENYKTYCLGSNSNVSKYKEIKKY